MPKEFLTQSEAADLLHVSVRSLERWRLGDLAVYAQKHDLKIVTIRDLIRYRLRNETLVRRGAVARMPTKAGEFKCIVYENEIDHVDHMALVMGEIGHD